MATRCSETEALRTALLGKRMGDRELTQYALDHLQWTPERFTAAVERAFRDEDIEYDLTTQTWGAGRSWLSGVAL